MEAIPEDRFGWKPEGETFTLGGIVVHLIQAEIFWSRLIGKAAAGEVYDPFPLPGEAGPERMGQFRGPNVQGSQDNRYGESFAALLESWRAVAAKTEEHLGALPDSAWDRTARHPLTGLETGIWEMLMVFVEHEAHHRGQLSAFLKIIGVSQPAVLGTP